MKEIILRIFDIDLRKATRHALALIFGVAICVGAAFEAHRSGVVPQWFVVFATGIVGSLIIERSLSKGVLDDNGNPIGLKFMEDTMRRMQPPPPTPFSPPDSPAGVPPFSPAEPTATTPPAEEVATSEARPIDTKEKIVAPAAPADPPQAAPPPAAEPPPAPDPVERKPAATPRPEALTPNLTDAPRASPFASSRAKPKG